MFFFLRPGSTVQLSVHCTHRFPLPEALVKSLTKDLIKHLPQNLVSNIVMRQYKKIIGKHT